MGTVPYNKELKTLSRSLRNSMTPHEQKLWYCFLRCQSPQFYRQKPLLGYIADFYCPKAKLSMISNFFNLSLGAHTFNWMTIIGSIVLAFVLSLLVAVVYKNTHRGVVLFAVIHHSLGFYRHFGGGNYHGDR